MRAISRPVMRPKAPLSDPQAPASTRPSGFRARPKTCTPRFTEVSSRDRPRLLRRDCAAGGNSHRAAGAVLDDGVIGESFCLDVDRSLQPGFPRRSEWRLAIGRLPGTTDEEVPLERTRLAEAVRLADDVVAEGDPTALSYEQRRRVQHVAQAALDCGRYGRRPVVGADHSSRQQGHADARTGTEAKTRRPAATPSPSS